MDTQTVALICLAIALACLLSVIGMAAWIACRSQKKLQAARKRTQRPKGARLTDYRYDPKQFRGRR